MTETQELLWLRDRHDHLVTTLSRAHNLLVRYTSHLTVTHPLLKDIEDTLSAATSPERSDT